MSRTHVVTKTLSAENAAISLSDLNKTFKFIDKSYIVSNCQIPALNEYDILSVDALNISQLLSDRILQFTSDMFAFSDNSISGNSFGFCDGKIILNVQGLTYAALGIEAASTKHYPFSVRKLLSNNQRLVVIDPISVSPKHLATLRGKLDSELSCFKIVVVCSSSKTQGVTEALLASGATQVTPLRRGLVRVFSSSLIGIENSFDDLKRTTELEGRAEVTALNDAVDGLSVSFVEAVLGGYMRREGDGEEIEVMKSSKPFNGCETVGPLSIESMKSIVTSLGNPGDRAIIVMYVSQFAPSSDGKNIRSQEMQGRAHGIAALERLPSGEVFVVVARHYTPGDAAGL